MKAAEIREKILNDHPQWAFRALVAIYRRQTADEQSSGHTVHSNGVGFSGADAEFGSSLAVQIMQGRSLSMRQIAYARKIAAKYAKQLERIANEKTCC